MQENMAQKSKDNPKASSQARSQAADQTLFGRLDGDDLGRFGASLAISSIEAGLSLFQDWRSIARAGADQVEENMKAVEDGWRHLSECESLGDYTRSGSEIGRSLAAHWVKSAGTMTALGAEFAGRRFQALSDMASAALHRAGKV
jgi:hypothetical protein